MRHRDELKQIQKDTETQIKDITSEWFSLGCYEYNGELTFNITLDGHFSFQELKEIVNVLENTRKNK